MLHSNLQAFEPYGIVFVLFFQIRLHIKITSMKTAWINLMTILRKFKFATALNLAGFAVAFAAYMVILMQLHFETSFEDCHPGVSRIYRVERSHADGTTAILSLPYIEAVLQSSPHIAAGSMVEPFANSFYFTLDDAADVNGYKETLTFCHPALPDVFSLDITEGSRNCLQEKGKILIPESVARKCFGKEPAVGHLLIPIYEEMLTGLGIKHFEIGGVYKDRPRNTQFANTMYVNVDLVKEPFGLDDWNNNNYLAYVRLDAQTSPADIIANFDRHFDQHFDLTHQISPGVRAGLTLTPIKELYFQTHRHNEGYQKTGDKDLSRLLSLIAFLIILIAAINYTNFCTSIAPLRLKSINTQKVLGASDFVLKKTLLAETMGVCLAGFLAGLGLVYLFHQTHFITFVDTDLALSDHRQIVWTTAGLAVLIGLASGLYPAYYTVKFPPALVLKGNYGLSTAGKKLRTALVGIQFAVSFALIIVAFFIYAQNQYMRHYNVGFQRDQIAVIRLGSQSMQHKDVYVQQLKQNPDIEDVAFSMFKFGGTNTYMQWGDSEASYEGRNFGCYVLPVSSNFFEVMGIRYEGLPLHPSYDSPDHTYMIPNQKLRKEFDMQVNGKINAPWRSEEGYPILGFADNVNPKSLKYGIENSCFMVGDNDQKDHSYIRIKAGADVTAVVEHIRATLKAVDPSWPEDVEFFDTIYNNLYKKERHLSQMIFLFSLLAVVISLVGVFALVMFETQYRYKEIGLRKVHGATTHGLLWMFNRYYLKILAICFLFASPFAWYGVNEWLKGFAYKTPLHWWIYALAFGIVAGITLLTVTYQSWWVATRNPTESIKTE